MHTIRPGLTSASRESLPALLSSKTLVKKCQNFRNIKLYVFEIEILLAVFLHLQKII
jgi:hypothetical protein